MAQFKVDQKVICLIFSWLAINYHSYIFFFPWKRSRGGYLKGWDFAFLFETVLSRTASVILASAPKWCMFAFKRQSLRVDAVIMMGAKEEVRWCYYRAKQSTHGRVNKISDLTKSDQMLVIYYESHGSHLYSMWMLKKTAIHSPSIILCQTSNSRAEGSDWKL